jgi:hypothetical protein
MVAVRIEPGRDNQSIKDLKQVFPDQGPEGAGGKTGGEIDLTYVEGVAIG